MCLNFYDTLWIKAARQRKDDFSYTQHRFRRYKGLAPDTASPEKTLNITYLRRIDESRLYYIGREAAYNKSFFILDGKGRKLTFDPGELLSSGNVRIESGFDQDLFHRILEQVIFIRLLLGGIVPVHSCSVEIAGEGYLFPAWGNTGKTRLIFNLISGGAKFISDEWSFIIDGLILPFRVDLDMHDYDICEYSGHIGLNTADKVRSFLSCRIRSDNTKNLLNRLHLILPYKRYESEKIFSSKSEKAALKKIFLLQRSNQTEVDRGQIRPEVMLERITVSFCRQISDFMYYCQLYRFAFGQYTGVADGIYPLYKQRLSDAIAGKEAFSLTLPASLKGVDLKGQVSK